MRLGHPSWNHHGFEIAADHMIVDLRTGCHRSDHLGYLGSCHGLVDYRMVAGLRTGCHRSGHLGYPGSCLVDHRVIVGSRTGCYHSGRLG